MQPIEMLTVLAGMAALAGPLAQNTKAQMAPNGWIIEVHDPILAPPGHSSGLPQSTLITIKAKFDSSEYYAFAAGRFDFVASESGGWSGNSLLAPFDGMGTRPGILSPTGTTDVITGQMHFPPFTVGDPSNPADVWTIMYTATEFTPRFIDLETLTSRFDLYIAAASAESRPLRTSMLMEGDGRIQIIPAPGSIACVGLAWLVIGRRRR